MGNPHQPNHKNSQPLKIPSDPDQALVSKTTLVYLKRHLQGFPDLPLEEGFWGFLGENLKDSLDYILEQALRISGHDIREKYSDMVAGGIPSGSRFYYTMPGVMEHATRDQEARIRGVVLEIIESRISLFESAGKGLLEKCLGGISRLFNLSSVEREFALFLYLAHGRRKLKGFFFDELHCQTHHGRKYLANALGIRLKALSQIFRGTLGKIEFFRAERDSLEINQDFLFLFDQPIRKDSLTGFFMKAPQTRIPLNYHPFPEGEIIHLKRLLGKKPKTGTHLLFYGPPGTGKSSLAQGLLKELALPSYTIPQDPENSSRGRRAGIIACLNLTNRNPQGSIILVDEADNLLNTEDGWLFRGETLDKAWLNQLMEEPGVRMIWISNRVDSIAPSVLRRFSFSLKFKGFTSRERIRVWENLIRSRELGAMVTPTRLSSYARKYNLNPGIIDLAIRKSLETSEGDSWDFFKTLDLTLQSHQLLDNFGEKPVGRNSVEDDYFSDGLNIKADIKTFLRDLGNFNQAMIKGDQGVRNYCLLFHGPPGTGKSEFARYLGRELDREVIIKTGSEFLNPYLGGTGGKIRAAFQQAEGEEAILIIDEVDSLLSKRELASRSWEITLTNQFLSTMEEFRGILIGATNRLETLDQACLRRFQRKLEFGYLTEEGKIVFYRRYFSTMVGAQLDGEWEERLTGIANLAPGDFRVVSEKYRLLEGEELSHSVLIAGLMEETRFRERQRGVSIVGF